MIEAERASRSVPRDTSVLAVRAVVVAVVASSAGFGACTTEKLSLGDRCERNSECPAPLVCRLSYCRKECNTTRDCAAGLSCVRDGQGLGACQLPPERSCVRDSDCTMPLVCRLGECVNECAANRDCPAGALCRAEDATGLHGCVDSAEQACVRASECAVFEGRAQVCALDGRCRDECRGDRDCRFGTSCCADTVCRDDCGPAGGLDSGPPPMLDAGTDAGRDAGGDTGPIPPGPCEPSIGSDPVLEVEVGDVGLTCARLTSGLVYCWGGSDSGALGMGPTTFRQPSASPVIGASDVVDLALDYRGALLALRSDGTLLTWGVQPDNAFFFEAQAPAGGAGLLDDVEKIAVGGGARCVIRRGLGAFCYGSNARDLLGDPAAPFVTSDPVAVIGASDAVDIALSQDGAYVVRSDGRVAAWGRALGNGDFTTVSPTAVDVPGITDAMAVFAGAGGGACVLHTTGDVSCWGSAVPGVPSTTPVSVVSGAVYVAADTEQLSCAILATGRLVCWGSGFIGDGMGPGVARGPVEIAGITDAVQVAMEEPSGQACVVTGAGRVLCWGQNGFGGIGDCTMDMRLAPVEVLGLP